MAKAKLSAVDQRLASALHQRQIEAIIRCESIGDAVDAVFDRAVSDFLAVVTSEGGEPFGKARHAGRIWQAAFQQARSTIDDQFRRMAYWGHGETVKAVAASIPRDWMRVAQPALALIPSQESEEDDFLNWLEKGETVDGKPIGKDQPATEAERGRFRRRRRDNNVADITNPQPVGRFRRRGGGPPGGRRRTARGAGEPDDGLPRSQQVTIPGQTLGNPADPNAIIGQDITANLYTEPLARGGRVSDEEWEKVLKEVVLPPPTPKRVEEILKGPPINGKDWQERFSDLSKKISNPEALASQLITGYSQGETLQQLTKRITPLVGGIKSSARRIARTEGLRVAETIQRDAWEDMGDMLLGSQIMAVLDQNTRPDHAARNGKLYYKQPDGRHVARDGEVEPMCPYAPNCRCWSTPVLKPPAEFENNPVVQKQFANDAGLGIPDPSIYSEWFQKVDAGRRKMAVGVKRYNTMAATLGDTRQPEWTDFIDSDGNLIDPGLLANESPLDRAARKQEVQQALDERKRLIHDVASRGFVSAK